MSFAATLREKVKKYNDSIDEGLISRIKDKCEEAATRGKTYIYIDHPLSSATLQTLKEREGLKVCSASISVYTYQVNW